MAFYYVVMIDNKDGTFSHTSTRAGDHIFMSRFYAEEHLLEWNQLAKRLGVKWRYIVVEVEHDD